MIANARMDVSKEEHLLPAGGSTTVHPMDISVEGLQNAGF